MSTQKFKPGDLLVYHEPTATANKYRRVKFRQYMSSGPKYAVVEELTQNSNQVNVIICKSEYLHP